jgi:hypothetical protein
MKLNENILRVKEIMGINESADAGENDIRNIGQEQWL